MVRNATILRLRRRRAAEAGVTLVELLISMVLLVVITGFLVGGIALGRRGYVADHASSADGETVTALDALGGLVSAALPTQAEKIGPRVAFDGRSDALDFVGLSAGHALPGGPLGFRIRRNGTNLEVEVIPPPGAAPLPQGQVSNVVLRAVSELRFSYFGAMAAGTPAVWQNEWLSADHLPALVRISVEFADSRRERPPLVVALRQR
ncbi:hypothetical protein [Tardiphaga robiniae]|uniref:Prepilin-type N-terminal cleavage/methylation domain-containing protein n=1 Tax=Tardiphaga robiniae TaxID=943830 RepID=A0A7G6TUM6_9BRAD|nr:hypothetical protein [Tardiphaga robiniae]QND70458.1 hypothetical protein HB776_03770 [Tardiphaga robiniae]